MRVIALIIGLFSSSILWAQPNDSKRDNTWLLGYRTATGELSSINGNIQINFTVGNFAVNTINANINYNEACAGISDTSGKMLFYTNGVIIVDSSYQIMQNSENFNECSLTSYWEGIGWGTRLGQGALVLPMPDNPNIYYLFYQAGYIINMGAAPLHLRYSTIDMSLNNGLGAVVDKKQDIVVDSLAFNGLTACRHANGRDWWIIMPQLSGYAYYLFLLSPQGVEDYSMQFIGDHIPYTFGQSVFTPDGRHYVRFHIGDNNPKCRLDIYDFDRCTGELSNFKRVWINDYGPIAGLAVSPNSRFAYCFTGSALYQYDLENDTTIHIADYDGFADPEGTVLAATLYQAQLAPNGKIYACASNSVRYLHVINHPNEAGAACDFVQHGQPLPVYNGFTIPNFPYFNLGRERGSACDTLYNWATTTPTLPTPAGLFGVSPNPANQQLSISSNVALPNSATFVLYNMLGQAVKSTTLSSSSSTQVSVTDIPSGIYLYQIINQNQIIQYGKVSILH